MRRYTAYIDPGVHHCAIAWFSSTEHLLTGVIWHETSRAAINPLAHDAEFTAKVELPVIRRGSRVRTSDLINLAAAAGRVAGNLPVTYITPESWKGQVPCTCTAKNTPEVCTHHRRMARALTPPERAIVDEVQRVPKSQLHNVYDAVTMGLKLEGRL